MYQVSGVSFHDYDNAIRNGYEQRLRITFPDLVLDEQSIYSTGIEYNEMLNGETDMMFGKAVCSSIRIPLVNDGSYATFDFQRRFVVELGVEVNGTMVYAPLGTFIGEKPKRLLQDTIDLIGYDLMTLFDTDAHDFLASLVYPLTISDIYTSLCAHIGVSGRTVGALNLNRVISASPFGGQGVTCRDVLGWLAEACGSYARMGRDGVCELVWFGNVEYSISGYDYFDLDVDEIIVPQIDQMRIQVTENDIGVQYPIEGTYDNPYTVYDNPYLYTESQTDLIEPTQSLYNRVHAFEAYKPCTVNTDGNWLIQTGDIITVVALDDEEEIQLPIFAMTLHWMGRADITYQSTGTEVRTPFTTATKSMIRENYRTHEFNVTLEAFESKILSETSHTYFQDTDPCDDPTKQVSVGDFWVRGMGINVWEDAQVHIWDVLKNYTWGDICIKTFCWDGTQWQIASDSSQPAKLSSRIEQTDRNITLEVERANAAEGQLSSQIDMTAEKVAIEVERAENAESELSAKIETTAEDIRLGVRSAGKVVTSESYILIENDKISVNSDGSIELKAGASFTVESNNFKIDESGNVSLTGTINARDGDIGGWKINESSLTGGKTGLAVTTQDTDVAIWAGNTTASNANFQVTQGGSVIAKLGSIGGWQIGSDYIGNKSTKNSSTVGLYANASGKNYVLWAGDSIDHPSTWQEVKNYSWQQIKALKWSSAQNKPPFSVTANGAIYAITGEIGGWKINDRSFTSEKVGLASTLSDNEIAIWAGDANPRNANFSVTQGGVVTITKGSLSIGGTSSSPNFAVDNDGNVSIRKGTISIGSSTTSQNFVVDERGNVTIKSGSITLGGTASSPNFNVDVNGNVTIKSGSITIGGTSSSPNFAVSNTGDITIKKGSINIGDGKFVVTSSGDLTAKSATLSGTLYAKSGRIGATESGGTYSGGFIITANKLYTDGKTAYNSASNGVYMGTDGIGLGSATFYVTSAGALTAKSGNIGGWYIGSDYIGNKNTRSSSSIGLHALLDTETPSETTVLWGGNSIASSANFQLKGDGSVIIKNGNITIKSGSISLGGTSSSPNFGVDANGNVTIKSGSISLGGTSASPNFAVDASGNVTVKYGSININSGKFVVASDGKMTSTAGEIAGWTIGTNILSKVVVDSQSRVVSNVGMASTGAYAFYAGQQASASDCAFKVTPSGEVYLTNLYTQVVDTSAPDYDEDDPSTWHYIAGKVDLGTNGYKIGDGYKTVKSVSGGKVRLSDGTTFNTATSVQLEGSWSGGIYTVKAFTQDSGGTKTYTGATNKTQQINSRFFNAQTGYFIESYYSSGGNPVSIGSSPFYYQLGFSAEESSFSSTTRVEIQYAISGTAILYTPSIFLTPYWNKAQNGVTGSGAWSITRDSGNTPLNGKWVCSLTNSKSYQSESVSTKFYNPNANYYYISAGYMTNTSSPVYVEISNVRYQLGLSNVGTTQDPYTSATEVQIQDMSGVKHSNTHTLSLSTYWSTAQSKVTGSGSWSITRDSGNNPQNGKWTCTLTNSKSYSSESVSVRFYNPNANYYYISAGYMTNTSSPVYTEISNIRYQLGVSGTSIQIQNTSGTQIENTPTLSLETKSITSNGTYTPSSGKVGFSSITVNVPSGSNYTIDLPDSKIDTSDTQPTGIQKTKLKEQYNLALSRGDYVYFDVRIMNGTTVVKTQRYYMKP